MAKRKKTRRKKGLGEVSAKEQPLRTGRAIASFIIPPVGLFTWATKQGEYDRKANTALALAGAGLGLGIISRIMWTAQQNALKKNEQ